MLPDGNWHEPDAADLAVAGDTIAGIAAAFAPVADAAIEELDGRGHLVLPGFVNAHYHSHDVLAKGTLEEVPLETWRLYALPPQYRRGRWRRSAPARCSSPWNAFAPA